jgi:hypothetical protein
MTITALPTAPARSDPPATFITRADAFMAALPTLVEEVNTATQALNLNATNDTSASSVAIGTGAKSFTVSAGKSYLGGMWLMIADTAAPSTNWMYGQITSYSGTALVMNITVIGGSGTKSSWVLSQSTDGVPVAASQAEMETGTETALRAMSPLRVKQAIDSLADQIRSISASVASSALTISASAITLDFRSTTLGSGAVTTVSGTPANLVISSGSTLGTVSGQQSRIAVLALNNAGTIELAAVNIAGGVDLSETGLISTTAEGGAGAADSATAIYSTAARSSVAYRVIGYIESTQSTAGTWATAPSTIQGAGGNALMGMSGLGFGQTWQSVTRNASTTYYNTTGKPIVFVTTIATSNNITMTIGGVALPAVSTGATGNSQFIAVIPPGMSYSYTGTSAGAGVYELR